MTTINIAENQPGWRKEAARPDLRMALMFAAGTFLVYVAFTAPGIYSIDGNSMLAVAESLVVHHSFTVPAGLGTPGVGGHIYSSWYPLLSILSVPLVWIASIASRTAHLPFHYLAAVFALPISAAMCAATAGVTGLLAIRMGASRQGAWLAALGFAFGSIALVYARTFFADPLLAFLTAAALYLTFGRNLREVLIASCLAALAILAKPTGVIVGPVLAAYLLAKRAPVRTIILPLAGTSAGFVLYAGYNVLRFGHPMSVGYALHFRLANVLPGAAGLLVSPGWGLLWYCPTVVLAIWGFKKAVRSSALIELLAVVAIFGGFLLVHSLWQDWDAGWAWGPRYLLPVIPGLCALTGLLEGKGKKALILLTAAGFLLTVPTTFSFYERYLSELTAQGIAIPQKLVWSVPRAPILHAWPAALREVRDARNSDVREIFGQRGRPAQTIESSRALRVVAVWWWVLPVARVPRWLGFLVALLLTITGAWLIIRCRTELGYATGAPSDLANLSDARGGTRFGRSTTS